MTAALRLVHDDDPQEPPRPELLGLWAVFMRANGHSEATIALYLRTVRALTRQARVEHELDLTRDQVVAFLGRPVKPWTRLTYWKAIERWSRFLRDFDHADVDLLRGMPRPRTPEPMARPINDAAVARLLEAKLSHRARAYVRLVLFQALRVHEIAKLRGQDFDFAHRWLTVEGKGGSRRAIPIHPEVVKLAELFPEFGYWFPSPVDQARPVSPVAVSQTIGAALAGVGCKATAHQLRDTAATQIQRQFKDIRVTQTMLRHRSISSTQKYVGVADDDLQEAVDGLSWERPGTPPPPPPEPAPAAAVDLSALSPEQLQALAVQLLTALTRQG